MDRKEVYKVIDGERDYQDEKWDNSLDRTVDEFASYIDDYSTYLNNLNNHTDEAKMKVVRKIAALAVACGESHGLPERDG